MSESDTTIKGTIGESDIMTTNNNPQCPHCQRRVESGATTCPHCGGNISKATVIAIGLFVAAIFGAVGLLWSPAYAGAFVGLLVAAAGWRYYPS